MNETQIEFQIAGNGGSQCDRIERVLRDRAGEWVPMPDLWRASGAFAVHSRISDLRRRGLAIEHRNERKSADGSTHSFYRLTAAEPLPATDRATFQPRP